MIQAGDVISYLEMCAEEGANLQRGMNYRLHGGKSVILMSLRQAAPYADRIEEGGRVLVYEGHDESKRTRGADPKTLDQPMTNPSGTLTQNGLFHLAASRYKENKAPSELVKVYEKIHPGIWAYNGLFRLVDAWQEVSDRRKVFRFRLQTTGDEECAAEGSVDIDHGRVVPSSVKVEVWKRDKGMCVICGSKDNLHFDHIIPYSKGGSSLLVSNIQLLCARHNLAKRDKIE